MLEGMTALAVLYTHMVRLTWFSWRCRTMPKDLYTGEARPISPRCIVADIVSKASLSEELAQHILDAAAEHAASLGQPSAIAIVDESGILKVFLRMDGAPLVSVQVAQDKAYTAAGFGISTDAWFDFIKDDPPLATGATAGIDRLVVFGGGYPITIDRAVVGGIGVSGGHYSEDMAVAQAGLAALQSPGV